MSAKGINLHAFTMTLPVTKEEKAAPLPLAELEALKGTKAILWVQLARKDGDDTDAVRALQQLNAVARALDLRIAIYPHVGNHCESLEGALRVADLADELGDAHRREGHAITQRENTHRMAEANKAFAHFAW